MLRLRGHALALKIFQGTLVSRILMKKLMSNYKAPYVRSQYFLIAEETSLRLC